MGDTPRVRAEQQLRPRVVIAAHAMRGRRVVFSTHAAKGRHVVFSAHEAKV